MIEDTARRAAALNEQIALMTRELDGLKVELREEIGEGGSLTVGDVTVRIEAAKRWDAALAAQVIPLPMQPEVSVPVIDRSLAQRKLPPETYAACQKASTPRVIFE